MGGSASLSSQVLATIDAGRLTRARALVEGGAVRSFRQGALDDLVLLAGCIRGEDDAQWRAHAVVDEKGVSGDCTCPDGRDCEHVAALALVGVEGPALRSDPAASDGGDPPSDPGRRAPQAAALEYSPAAADRNDERHMAYLLRVSDDGSELSVCPSRVARGRCGRSKVSTPFALSRLGEQHQPDYIRDSDLAILHALSDLALQAIDLVWYPLGARSSDLLREIIATGRCHWESARGTVLALDEPLPARLQWVVLPSGSQRLEMIADDDVDSVTLPLLPPWRIDPASGRCRPLVTPADEGLVADLLAAGPVAPDAIGALGRHLRNAPESIPRPRELAVESRAPERPQPRLDLRLVEISEGKRLATTPTAALVFAYGEVELTWDSEDAARLVGQDRVVRVVRDSAFEDACIERLKEYGLVALQATGGRDYRPGEGGLWVARQTARTAQTWLDVQQRFERLRAEGWRIDVDASFAPILMVPDDWYGDLKADADSTDGFELDFGVVSEGRRWSLLPALLDWLDGTPEGVLRLLLSERPMEGQVALALDERRVVLMPMALLAVTLGSLTDLFETRACLHGGRVRLPRGRLPELAEAEGVWRFDGDPALIELTRRLREFKRIEPCPEPAGFKAELRDYQRLGLGWLQFLREFGFGGILADDMGLGKTIQALAHVLAEKRAGRLVHPCLVVAPTSLMFNWRAEAHRFAPDLRVLLLHGPERKGQFQWIGESDLVLTTYALVARDVELLGRERFELLILDEAQAIKNPRARAGVAVRALDARRRLCLTGTPLENHVGDVWSLFDFLMPGLLGTRTVFRRLFQNPIERHGDEERRAVLARRIKPFFLRRTKAEVAPELPPKTDMLRVVALGERQRKLYERVRVAMHEKVRRALARQGAERSQVLVLDALLRLRQICCHPQLARTIDGVDNVGSAKLDLLMELLPEMLEEGRRVLVFSQFVGMLKLIEREILARDLAYTMLTGKTRNRQRVVELFQTGRVPLFLISLKAGGVGLNLTAADTVIHYDPWWNPAVEDQATDRAHRIGQDQKVFVYKLLTENTVEQRVFELQQAKRGLIEGLLGGGGAAALTPDVIDELFRPIE